MVAMNVYQRPTFPSQMYSGGYWYALAAAVLYLALAAGLISNILGYIRGHYCQHFELSHDQRTLIVQTMCYFIWLAGGAAVYSKIEGWSFIDSVSAPLPSIESA
jgi:potassium channel subfamily K